MILSHKQSMKTNAREYLLKDNPNLIQEYRTAIKVIKTLHRKYGEKLLRKEVRTVIEKNSPISHGLLNMLVTKKHYNKKDIQAIHHTIQDIKEKYDPTVEVVVPSIAQTESLKNMFPTINTTKTEQTGITIKTQGKIYKREANTDIEKLLHI